VTITHINPAGLHTNPAFSQATLAEGGRTLYIGGQNGTDSAGAISGDFAAQTRQAYRNVLAILSEVGADQSAVVKLTIYLVAGQSIADGFAASVEVWGLYPTALTVVEVAGLGRPEALVEIDAVAVV
jgi:enamine deaminase RidA (YjgF/YER057c/UK114 family)